MLRCSVLLDSDKIINDFIGEAWWTKENSNIPYSIMSLNCKISEAAIKNYWLNQYTPEIRKGYNDRLFHIHNLGALTTYCVGWNLEDVLKMGFRGQAGKQSSSPPKHFRSALGQVCNFMYTLQGESAGAQALSNFDTYLAPFIRYDHLTQDDVNRSIRDFKFNMGVSTRIGGQPPFTNITLDQNIPKHFEDDYTIFDGKLTDDTFGSFQDEIEMFDKGWWTQVIKGDADGRTQPFPIETLNVTKDFNWDDELLFTAVAKRGSPYFSNFINSDMKPEDVRSMCPLGGSEKVLIMSKGPRFSKIREIYNDLGRDIVLVYANGKFVRGRFAKYENQKLIKITLANNNNITMTTTHTNIIKRGPNYPIETVSGLELSENMFLPYSLNVFKGYGGTYNMGYIVGAFAGDGSFDRDNTTVFSLNINEKLSVAQKIKDICSNEFGATFSEYINGKLLSLHIHSKAVMGLCKDYIRGMGIEKEYTPQAFISSIEFRKGILDGHLDTDGGNRNRIYTSSEKMVDSLNILSATMGTTTSIQVDYREGRYSLTPNYSVLIYKLNRDNYGEYWFKEDGFLWMRIKSIEETSGSVGYCLEVIGDEPLFSTGTGIVTHNCRLRIDNTVLLKKGGGYFGSSPLTGSIGVVTLNMPLLAYKSTDEDTFFENIEYAMELSKDSLEIKRMILEKNTQTSNTLYPYSKIYLKSVFDRFQGYWKNHFSTIGLIGMNEACMNLIHQSIATKEGQDLSIKVLNFMRQKSLDFQDETDNMYNIEATPGEGTSYRLAMLDKAQYPDIYTSGIPEAPYYTNSTQMPVNSDLPLSSYIKHQSPIQKLYTGGTVMHIWNGESMSHWKGVSNLMKNVLEKSELTYTTYTPTTSVCPTHGFMMGEHNICPKCGAVCEVWTRVTGYFAMVSQFNIGKQQEFKERHHFNVQESIFD